MRWFSEWLDPQALPVAEVLVAYILILSLFSPIYCTLSLLWAGTLVCGHDNQSGSYPVTVSTSAVV